MKRFLAALLAAFMLLSMCACEYTKDGDKGYVPYDEYTLPNRATAEQGSVPFVVAELIAKGQVVRDYNKLVTATNGAEEGYSIRTNGINVEIYRFAADSEFLKEIVKLGSYPIKDDSGKVLATRRAVVNGNIVMMIPSEQNSLGEDISELNQKLVERFEKIKLN